jgi:hypothetical protein
MKSKNYLLIFLGLLSYTFIYIVISHTFTVEKINSLRKFNNISFNRNDLNEHLHKSYSELKNKKEITDFSNFMNITIPENATVYKIFGKGLPYYYGAIILDTLNNKVINVTLRELQ